MNLHGLLFEKLQLKLLSLLFATLLWCFVTMESPAEADIPLAVFFVNPPGMAVGDVSARGLRVRIAGPRILLVRQRLRGAEARIDLAGTPAGRVVVSGLERFVRLDDGVRLLQVVPGSLAVTLKSVK
jgi:hypothetical protein